MRWGKRFLSFASLPPIERCLQSDLSLSPAEYERLYCDSCLPTIQGEQRAAFAAAGTKALGRLAAQGRDTRHEGEAARKRAPNVERETD